MVFDNALYSVVHMVFDNALYSVVHMVFTKGKMQIGQERKKKPLTKNGSGYSDYQNN